MVVRKGSVLQAVQVDGLYRIGTSTAYDTTRKVAISCFLCSARGGGRGGARGQREGRDVRLIADAGCLLVFDGEEKGGGATRKGGRGQASPWSRR